MNLVLMPLSQPSSPGSFTERGSAPGKHAGGRVKRLAEMSSVDEATFGSFTSAKDFLSTVFVAHEYVIDACVKGRKITASAAEAETEDLLFE